MRKNLFVHIFSIGIIFTLTPLHAAQLPQKLEATLQRALDTKDPFIIEATFSAALKELPQYKTVAALKEYVQKIPTNTVLKPRPVLKDNALVVTKEQAKWSGDITAAFDKSSGNTDTENILSSINLEREKKHWRHKFFGQVRFANEDGERINEDYRLRLGSDWKFDDVYFLFGEIEYVADEFSGFDYRVNESVGLGARWQGLGGAKPKERYLDIRASVGARHLKSTDPNVGVEHNAIFRPVVDFNWKVNDNLTFKQLARSTIGTDVTISEAETSLKYKLNSKLDLKLAFQLEHTSNVPIGTKKLETYTSTGLTYRLFD